MKKTLKHQLTNSEPRSTTKKYIERIAETKEAEKAIEDFLKDYNESDGTCKGDIDDRN